MSYSAKIKRGESIIYLVIWLIIFLMPVFFSQRSDGVDWNRVTREWVKIIPFLFVFLFHNYILFPLFFIQKKYLYYFGLTLLLIIGISFITIFIGREVGPSRGFLPEIKDLPPPQQKPLGNIPPPGSMKLRTGLLLLFEDFITSVLVIGFNAAIKITIKWQDEEQKNKELEKQKLESELAFLKNQVSPHFFMNTLNNIHALIDINSEDAKESVIQLSKLMRYLLYDSELGKTTLSKEIEFIKSYVDLMKLRFTSKVSIKLSFPEKIPNIEIPPMLFTSLLENAFKHGVSYQKKSFIEIILRTENNNLWFRIKNSKQSNDNGIIETGGLGLENLKKRLDLLYGRHYILQENDTEETFDINIKLPIYE